MRKTPYISKAENFLVDEAFIRNLIQMHDHLKGKGSQDSSTKFIFEEIFSKVSDASKISAICNYIRLDLGTLLNPKDMQDYLDLLIIDADVESFIADNDLSEYIR